MVMHFQPSFVLMENVVDTLRKEDGMYAKSAMGSLLLMKYQVRMGIIAACDQGVPQARNRCACAVQFLAWTLLVQRYSQAAVNCAQACLCQLLQCSELMTV